MHSTLCSFSAAAESTWERRALRSGIGMTLGDASFENTVLTLGVYPVRSESVTSGVACEQ